jgi:hypothetical protein
VALHGLRPVCCCRPLLQKAVECGAAEAISKAALQACVKDNEGEACLGGQQKSSRAS